MIFFKIYRSKILRFVTLNNYNYMYYISVLIGYFDISYHMLYIQETRVLRVKYRGLCPVNSWNLLCLLRM